MFLKNPSLYLDFVDPAETEAVRVDVLYIDLMYSLLFDAEPDGVPVLYTDPTGTFTEQTTVPVADLLSENDDEFDFLQSFED